MLSPKQLRRRWIERDKKIAHQRRKRKVLRVRLTAPGGTLLDATNDWLYANAQLSGGVETLHIDGRVTLEFMAIEE